MSIQLIDLCFTVCAVQENPHNEMGIGVLTISLLITHELRGSEIIGKSLERVDSRIYVVHWQRLTVILK